MKPWKKLYDDARPDNAISVLVKPKEQEVSVPSFMLKCISCSGVCEMLFEGSSFCQACLKEKLRVGH